MESILRFSLLPAALRQGCGKRRFLVPAPELKRCSLSLRTSQAMNQRLRRQYHEHGLAIRGSCASTTTRSSCAFSRSSFPSSFSSPFSSSSYSSSASSSSSWFSSPSCSSCFSSSPSYISGPSRRSSLLATTASFCSSSDSAAFDPQALLAALPEAVQAEESLALMQYQKALPLLQRAYDICKHSLGPTHPATNLVLEKFIRTNLAVGDPEAAEGTAKKQAADPTAPLSIFCVYAETLLEQMKPREALTVCKRALGLECERTRDPDSGARLRSLAAVSELFCLDTEAGQEKRASVVEALRRSVAFVEGEGEEAEQAQGCGVEAAAFVWRNKGAVEVLLRGLGEHERASGKVERASREHERASGEKERASGEVETASHEQAAAKKRNEEAAGGNRDSSSDLDTAEEGLGDDARASWRKAESLLASAEEFTGAQGGAESKEAAAPQANKDVIRRRALLRAACLCNIGQSYVEERRYEEASPVLGEALKLQEQHAHDHSTQLARTLMYLARCYHRADQAVVAEGLFTTSIETYSALDYIRVQDALDLSRARGYYAALLREWEKRGSAAATVSREAREAQRTLPRSPGAGLRLSSALQLH